MANKFNVIQNYKDEQQHAESVINQERIKVFAIFAEAWPLAKKAIGMLILALLVNVMLNLLVSVPAEMILSYLDESPFLIFIGSYIVLKLILGIFFSLPLFIGFFMLGVNCARGQPLSIKMLFAYFKVPIFWQIFKWLGWVLLIGLSISLVFFALLSLMDLNLKQLINNEVINTAPFSKASWAIIIMALTYIYFTAAYFYSLPLIADKKLHAGFALTVSRKGFNRNILPLIGINLIIISIPLVCIKLAMMLPAIINLIAVILVVIVLLIFYYPWFNVVNGLAYNKIFKTPAINGQQ